MTLKFEPDEVKRYVNVDIKNYLLTYLKKIRRRATILTECEGGDEEDDKIE